MSALLTRIASARRFAVAMTNDADKEMFSIAATELEGELLRCQSIQRQPIPPNADRVLQGRASVGAENLETWDRFLINPPGPRASIEGEP